MKFNPLPWLCVVALSLTCASVSVAQDDDSTTSDANLKRVTEYIKYLASDELGGRKPGTEGIEKAAKFIEDEYKKYGLKPLKDGTYRQILEVPGGRAIDAEETQLVFKGPKSAELELDLNKEFVPMISGRRGIDLQDAKLAFVGYGISAPDLNYDEYRGVDVEGKIVVLIRREPQQKNPDSVFDGDEISEHSYIATKVDAAREAGAAAIIMVNDAVSAPTEEDDTLEESGRFTSRLPFVQIRRATFDKILDKAPLWKPNGKKFESLSQIEKHIDKTLSPVSQSMNAWKCMLSSSTKRQGIKTANVVGIIEGEGPLADETIVIGGHYDHLGRGGQGSRRPGNTDIHNGADDNATGTAAVMELARRFAKRDKKPARRMVFICFTAEEMGLLGAQHYVKEPLFDLEKTSVMVNFDMIGWLREDKLTVYNATSAKEFEKILDDANEGMGDAKLDIIKGAGFAGSDHLPFFQKQIPVMFLHTGLTSTYHTPEDDFETIDCAGALKVIDYSEKLLDELDGAEGKLTFQGGGGGRRRTSRVRLGVQLDDDHEKGVEITNVVDDSLADKAGLKTGDVITSVNDTTTQARRELVGQLRANDGKKITVKFLRGDDEKEVEIELKN